MKKILANFIGLILVCLAVTVYMKDGRTVTGDSARISRSGKTITVHRYDTGKHEMVQREEVDRIVGSVSEAPACFISLVTK